MQQEHIGVKGPPGTRWRTLSLEHQGKTETFDKQHLLLQSPLPTWSAAATESRTSRSHGGGGEALSGLHHSRKFTKQNLVSKQAVLARGGPGLLCWYGHAGNRAPSVPRRHGMGFRCPGHQASIATWQRDTGKPGAGQQTLRTSGCYPELLSRVKQETPE